MIILVCGKFAKYKRGIKVGEEFVASHGINPDTMETVIVPCEHPVDLGAKCNETLGEVVLYD